MLQVFFFFFLIISWCHAVAAIWSIWWCRNVEIACSYAWFLEQRCRDTCHLFISNPWCFWPQDNKSFTCLLFFAIYYNSPPNKEKRLLRSKSEHLYFVFFFSNIFKPLETKELEILTTEWVIKYKKMFITALWSFRCVTWCSSSCLQEWLVYWTLKHVYNGHWCMNSWLHHVSSWGPESTFNIILIYLYAYINVLMFVGNSGSKAKTFAHKICIT